jgi:hypothetical protein
MAPSESYSIVADTIDGQLAETVRRWGYTVQKKESGGWVYWQIAEFFPYEVIAARKLDPHIQLWGIADQTCYIYPEHYSPEELQKAIGAFVKPVLKRVVTILAWKELRKILHDACRKGVGLMSDRIMVEIAPETLHLKFELGDDGWDWEITLENGKPVAIIRQPLCEHPIRTVMEIAKCFAVALI